MDSAPGAALLIISGTASGETFFGPESRSTSWLCSSVPMPPMPVPMMQAIRVGVVRQLAVDQPASASASSPATIANCVKRSARRASLTDRCSLGSYSRATPSPSSIPDLAGEPALIQGAGADTQRGDGADTGDDDLGHPARFTTRSTASPTVLILPTSSPLSFTPYSSSMICDSSARSSESTSSSSKVASSLISSGSGPNCARASRTVVSTASGVMVSGHGSGPLSGGGWGQALMPPSTNTVDPVT